MNDKNKEDEKSHHKQLKFFLSHFHKDKHTLSPLRDIFRNHGIQLFLAHEDIKGGEDYNEKIKYELGSSDVFLIYSNKESKKSGYCNQEIGWSLTLNKPFIIIGDSSYEGSFDWGLMPKTQCYKLKQEKEFECFADIVSNSTVIEVISKIPEYKEKLSCIKILKDEGYNGFYVHDKFFDHIKGVQGPYSPDWIHLIPGTFDDYSFRTEFIIKYGKNEDHYKICCEQQPIQKHTFEKIDKQFLWLPETFLSRDITADEKFSAQRKKIHKAISILLNDCENNGNLKNKFKNKEVLEKSLYRDEIVNYPSPYNPEDFIII